MWKEVDEFADTQIDNKYALRCNERREDRSRRGNKGAEVA
jgi:hypothetical protein